MGYTGPTQNRIDLLALANKTRYTTGDITKTISNYYPFAAD